MADRPVADFRHGRDAHYQTSGSGHLYQGRFESFPVQSDEHLLRVMRYVERNPPRNNLGSKDRLMDGTKRKAIEAAGWKVGDAADFLAMSDEERQLLDTRVQLALAVRRQREAQQLSQKQLGAILKTSQPRVAKIERAASDVSMDQLVRAFTAAGGRIVVKTARAKKGQKTSAQGKTLVLEVSTSE